jgi:hypothetical protein
MMIVVRHALVATASKSGLALSIVSDAPMLSAPTTVASLASAANDRPTGTASSSSSTGGSNLVRSLADAQF